MCRNVGGSRGRNTTKVVSPLLVLFVVGLAVGVPVVGFMRAPLNILLRRSPEEIGLHIEPKRPKSFEVHCYWTQRRHRKKLKLVPYLYFVKW